MLKYVFFLFGFNLRFVDLVYVFMLMGVNLLGIFFGWLLMSLWFRFLEQKVENYICDIFEGFYFCQIVMIDKEKKKFVVCWLEQFFIGKIIGCGICCIFLFFLFVISIVVFVIVNFNNEDNDLNMFVFVIFDVQG